MDRRPPGLGPESEDKQEPPLEATTAHGDLSEAEWDRILPPIDEGDPEWQAYVRRKIRESLDDPRPPISAEEVHRRILERHEAYLKRGA